MIAECLQRRSLASASPQPRWRAPHCRVVELGGTITATLLVGAEHCGYGYKNRKAGICVLYRAIPGPDFSLFRQISITPTITRSMNGLQRQCLDFFRPSVSSVLLSTAIGFGEQPYRFTTARRFWAIYIVHRAGMDLQVCEDICAV